MTDVNQPDGHYQERPQFPANNGEIEKALHDMDSDVENDKDLTQDDVIVPVADGYPSPFLTSKTVALKRWRQRRKKFPWLRDPR